MIPKHGFWRSLRKLAVRLVQFFKHSPKGLYNLDFRSQKKSALERHALISYLTYPFLISRDSPDFFRHQQTLCAIEMVRMLNDLGYLVDVIDFRDIQFKSKTEYDLFIGHGGINYEYISRQLTKRTIQIYFSTGIYWKGWNIREARRICDTAERRGYLLSPDRVIKESEEFANQSADGIICLGNQAAVETYHQFRNVIGINNFVFPGTKISLEEKDFESGRQHFLFFSGPGNIHKGLDLLLEAFNGTDLHLHICQQIDERFAVVYHQELTESPNIHLYGKIPLRSPEFERLTCLCNFSITATCAEGQPGAVLECMARGLIPVLPVSANIDLGEFGFLLPDCKIETIKKMMCSVSQMPVDECRKRSYLTMQIARNEYSLEQYKYKFKDAVLRIVTSSKIRYSGNSV
jgi:glycosyltransferase involved in cell wall biosynthesis